MSHLLCLIPDPSPAGGRESDVWAQLTTQQLSSSPKLEALVIWGYPGDIELEMANLPLDLNNEALIKLQNTLPQLVDALKNAVKRGRPAVPPSNQHDATTA